MREQGASTFALLSQGSGNEFWQTNFDRESGTYERVYNVELRLGLGFGFSPNPSPSPSPNPNSKSSPCPDPEPEMQGLGLVRI